MYLLVPAPRVQEGNHTGRGTLGTSTGGLTDECHLALVAQLGEHARLGVGRRVRQAGDEPRVGRVVEVERGHALVRLLTDPNSGVAGIAQGSRAQGMVVGQGTDVLDLLYVPRFTGVIHGDRVVTSGIDGIFPRGFGVGEVIDIQEKPDGSQTIRLRPELDYRNMEDVMILLEPIGGEILAPSGVERPQ